MATNKFKALDQLVSIGTNEQGYDILVISKVVKVVGKKMVVSSGGVEVLVPYLDVFMLDSAENRNILRAKMKPKDSVKNGFVLVTDQYGYNMYVSYDYTVTDNASEALVFNHSEDNAEQKKKYWKSYTGYDFQVSDL